MKAHAIGLRETARRLGMPKPSVTKAIKEAKIESAPKYGRATPKADNVDARQVSSGHEPNPRSKPIWKPVTLIQWQNVATIIFGNTLADDGPSNDRPARC
ncbi:MAG: hypothetical protein WCP53_11880 [Verrucomicrobiota bacterium]